MQIESEQAIIVGLDAECAKVSGDIEKLGAKLESLYRNENVIEADAPPVSARGGGTALDVDTILFQAGLRE